MPHLPRIPFLLALAAVTAPVTVRGAAVTWDNSSGDNLWSTAANWDGNSEPDAAAEVIFPVSLAGGTVSLANGELAHRLQFDGAFTLSGGGLTLSPLGGAESRIQVSGGSTATISTPLTFTGAIAKTGGGTLVLAAATSHPFGFSIRESTLRVTHALALGSDANGLPSTVEGGATLEIANVSIAQRLNLMHGATLAASGGPASRANGAIAIDSAATSIQFRTGAAGDLLTIGDNHLDLTGGSAATVIGLTGPGTLRLPMASSFDGSWTLGSGSRLELGNPVSLGDQASSSLTIAGSTLVGLANSGATFTTSPANRLIVTADSKIVSAYAGLGSAPTYRFGTLGIGSQTLDVSTENGSGTIALGQVTLSGDPTFSVRDTGASTVLQTGFMLGGTVQRHITKTGDGDLTVLNGVSDLVEGSTFTNSGSGTVELRYPALGSDAAIATTTAQNPFGDATLVNGGSLLSLRVSGADNGSTQTFSLRSPIRATGTSGTLDLGRNGLAYSNKTIEIPSLTLAAGSVLKLSSATGDGLRVSGGIFLEGSAALQGIPASYSGLVTLNGGIHGGPTAMLDLGGGGGAPALNIAINAASTHGGGTSISAGNVTLNAANALGPGPLQLTGGMLTLNAANAIPGNLVLSGAGTVIVNADDAVGGTIQLTSGILRLADPDALDTTPIHLNGGTLDLRSNTSTTFATGGLSVSGNSSLTLGNLNGTASAQTLTLPLVTGSGSNAKLSVTPSNNYIALFGDLHFEDLFILDVTAGTTKVQTLTEGSSPAAFVKSGAGALQLFGPSARTGNSWIWEGDLVVADAAALGMGGLMLGTVDNAAPIKVSFNPDLVFPNIVIPMFRTAPGGEVTLSSPQGGVTWSGPFQLHRSLRLENLSTTRPSFVNGTISSPGPMPAGVIKAGNGEIILGGSHSNLTNNGVSIQGGHLTVSHNGSLGPVSASVQLSGGFLKIAESFSCGRIITTTGTAATGVNVTPDREFTLSGAGKLAGSGPFHKTGLGIMTLAPEVDSSARGNAATFVSEGTLRVQSATGLSANGPLHVSGSYATGGIVGRVELLRDQNTTFPYPVFGKNGIVHVDRSPGGTRENGRHTLGPLTLANDGRLTVTGGHGYGLSLGTVNLTDGGADIENHAPAPLILSGVNYAANGTLNLSSAGEFLLEGSFTKSVGVTNCSLGVYDAKLRLGSSISTAAINGNVSVFYDGLLDTNGLSLNASSLSIGAGHEPPQVPDYGPRIDMGAGTFNLSGALNYTTVNSPGHFAGHLHLSSGTSNFSIGLGHGNQGLTIDGPISGSGGINVSGGGILRLTGQGNSLPGPLKITAGEVKLGKSSGLAIGVGGLQVDVATNTPLGSLTLLAHEQIDDSAPVSLKSAGNSNVYGWSPEAFLDLGNFTETVGPLSATLSNGVGFAGVKTGPQGKLVLNGNVSFTNNSFKGTMGREVMIGGPGTLDLGGAVRTIQVSGLPLGGTAELANAAISARIVNGGIIKTGNRTLYLTHPANQISGGIGVREGFIGFTAPGSLGSGGVTFTNPPGTLAGWDFGGTTGPVSAGITVGGSGDFEIRHSGDNAATGPIIGPITLERNLVVNVVEGPFVYTQGATLHLLGVISDGSSSFGLTKKGDGALKLGPTNAYSGQTVIERGTLWITGPGSLGDGNAPLLIDGGCLMAADHVTLPRDVTFTAKGGTLRSDGAPGLELSGHVNWGNGTAASFGSGTTIISGSTSGSGNFQLGQPIAFTTNLNYVDAGGGCLSLRGPAALPSGNLKFHHYGVLELGNGDFTMPLGTGPGQFQMYTYAGGGWAAHGADRRVNVGGAGETLAWGQANPPFLYWKETNYSTTGDLVLGSATATHTINFENPLSIGPSGIYQERNILVIDGSAAIDARITGDITFDPAVEPLALDLYGTGASTLEITGDLLGDFILYQNEGTTIFRGANEAQEMNIDWGKWIFTTPASLGAPHAMYIYGEVDVSALPGGLVIDPEGELDMGYEESLVTGDVTAPARMSGWGSISGDLLIGSPSLLIPTVNHGFTIGGDFSMAAGSVLRCEFPQSMWPEQAITTLRVGGSVALQGKLELQGTGSYFDPGDVFTLISNAGSDPIQGSFEGMPEGCVIPAGAGLGFRLSYQANVDGGPVANDVTLTLIPLAQSSDQSLGASAPVTVEPGAEFAIRYLMAPAAAAKELRVQVPAGVSFISSEPAGQWNAASSTFTFALTPQPPEATVNLVIHLAAPSAPVAASVRVPATYGGTEPGDPVSQVTTVTAVLPGDHLPVPSITRDPAKPGELQLTIDTLEGVQYLCEVSYELQSWYPLESFTGTGEPVTTPVPIQTEWWPVGFHRFRIVPPGSPDVGE